MHKYIDDLVSVIVPTHNGQDLRILLNSIKNSTYKNVEIIIVNEGLERSAQRNIGIKRAKGKYLLFLDSDMAVSKDLIEECVRLIKYYKALYCPEIIKTKGLFGKIRNFERQFYTGTAVDVVRFVKAYRCPKFDENMHGPEDTDWDRRVFGERYTTISPVYHYDNIGIKRYCQKKAYYTKSMNLFEQKNPNDKILNLKYRCFTIFTEDGKWKRLLQHPFLTLGIMFILLLRAFIYLPSKLCLRKS